MLVPAEIRQRREREMNVNKPWSAYMKYIEKTAVPAAMLKQRYASGEALPEWMGQGP
jgi:hypothetical protein